MKAFVLDASLAMEWLSKDPSASALDKRSLFDDRVAVVPALWRYEVMSVITQWQRQGEITSAEAALLLSDALQLPFAVVEKEVLMRLWRLQTSILCRPTTPRICEQPWLPANRLRPWTSL